MFLNEDNQVGFVQLLFDRIYYWGADCLGVLGN